MHVNVKKPLSRKTNSKGFTLVELVFGIILFSVSMVTIVSVLMPQSKQGIDPLWQVRAIALAQSLLTEISSKAFDESSITVSGRQACNNGTNCTVSGSLGPESGEARSNFDDIDDYNGLVLSGVDISNAAGNTRTSEVEDLFLGFAASINVFYDDNSDGIDDDTANSGTLSGNQKLITVIVVTPGGEEIPFSAYRKNF
jgi:MSHA pilin protein MshD